ncbi:hypothetical protein PR048_024705 [Dryococelus australis]|uniref:DUF4817 domain-containing protein n=1 Tax=Dryococelus australis TaxID=614101 RepID=A0ABQ9GPF1_9NEOP|nr:hypothetical protein PR048_024705 [Dryococelus australis]
MERFTRAELGRHGLVYGTTNTSARQAVELYQLRYPGRRRPSRATSVRLHQRLRNERSTTVTRQSAGASRTDEDVLLRVQQEVYISSQAVGHALGVGPFNDPVISARKPTASPAKQRRSTFLANVITYHVLLSVNSSSKKTMRGQTSHRL